MKTLQHYLKNGPSAILLFIFGLLTSVKTLAQEGGADIKVDIDGDDGAWYGYWWVWAIGVAVFLIIIVAIVSAGKKT